MTEKDRSDLDAEQRRAEKAERKAEEDAELERELEDSFPASDPPSVTQPNVTPGSPDHAGEKGGAK
ncbi:MAG: hypothetical protein ACLPSF_03120 [Methylocella sp.]